MPRNGKERGVSIGKDNVVGAGVTSEVGPAVGGNICEVGEDKIFPG
ncbi:MAG: hypothetical protein UY22_C0050G0008 [Candidatus Amesbacteria bacterium GW2011_GWC1_48_10]|uniref:Uncharacterized protein n=1 Tax=Candidatus Amesbacteria bacterium GW2011_GWC1_48_10 TaxID=1618365 RepID=A0A0G1WK72_9BACT|nr:MAG: hypothetical protein UY22_C0050G0008 [Candidatus Amesbacteria bacterium GW2011_GWC1_48_10]